MKLVFLTLVLALGNFAFAGTAMSVKNDSLGFTYTAYPQGDHAADICSASGKCYSFDYVKSMPNNTILYREKSGKCEVTVQTFEKSFRDGQTQNEYMLDLMAFVVRVVKGEDKCQLPQSGTENGLRSLTGIYE